MDDLTIPVAPSTARIATDLIARPGGSGDSVAHAQIGKLYDGRDGGTNPLAVNDDGSLTTGLRFQFMAAFLGDIAQPSYDAGDLVGSVAACEGNALPQGLYRVPSVVAVDLSGGALPAGLRVVLFGEDPTPGLVSVADGDAFAAAGFSPGAAAAVLIDGDTIAAGVGKHPLFVNASVPFDGTKAVPFALINSSGSFDGSSVTPHVALVAEDAIASPPSGPIAVALLVEQVSITQANLGV